jgi:hypothetical protein
MTPQPPARQSRNSLRYPEATLTELLFLYFWPTTIFEDASTGSREERWAKYRRNREKRVYLLHYGRIWSFFSVFFLASGLAVADNFPRDVAAQLAATAIFTAFTCSLTVVIVVVVAYIWFTRNE